MILKKSYLLFLSFILILFVLYFIFSAYFPFTDYAYPYDGDDGIVVMMAQNPIHSLFSFFYYGQDRLGAYLYVFVHLISKLIRHTPSANTIYIFSFLYFIFAAFQFFKTIKVNPYFTSVLLLFLLFIFQQCGSNFFAIKFPYLCQISSLFLFVHYFITSISDIQKIKWPTYIVSCLFIFLSISSSPVTFGYLISIYPIIIYYLKSHQEKYSIIKFSTLYLFSITFGFISYEIIKILYHSSNLANYGTTYEHSIYHINLHNYVEKFITVFLKYFTLPWIIILISTFCFCIALIKKNKHHLVYLCACLILMAILNFSICISSSWVEYYKFDFRFFTPTFVFILIAFSIILSEFISFFNEKIVFINLIILICMSLIISQIKISESLNHIRGKRIADALTQLYPNTPLLGEYWVIYFMRGLQSNLNSISYPISYSYDRTPWTICTLKVGSFVLVSNTSAYIKPDGPSYYGFNTFGFDFRYEEDKTLKDNYLPFLKFRIISGKRNAFDKKCD